MKWRLAKLLLMLDVSDGEVLPQVGGVEFHDSIVIIAHKRLTEHV